MSNTEQPWLRGKEGSPLGAFAPTVEIFDELHRFMPGWCVLTVSGLARSVAWATSNAWAIRCFGAGTWDVRFPNGFDAERREPAPDLSSLGAPLDCRYQDVVDLAKGPDKMTRFTVGYSFPDGRFLSVKVRLHGLTFHYGSTEPAPHDLPVAILIPLDRG